MLPFSHRIYQRSIATNSNYPYLFSACPSTSSVSSRCLKILHFNDYKIFNKATKLYRLVLNKRITKPVISTLAYLSKYIFNLTVRHIT